MAIQHNITDLYRGDDYVWYMDIYDAPTDQGSWNADLNSPDLSGLVPAEGDFYTVSVAGATVLNGYTDWEVGDRVWYDGDNWVQVRLADLDTVVRGPPIDLASNNWSFALQVRSKFKHKAGSVLYGDGLTSIDPVEVHRIWCAIPKTVSELIDRSKAYYDIEVTMPPPSIFPSLLEYVETLVSGVIEPIGGQVTE